MDTKIIKINENARRLLATSLSVIIFGMSGGCIKSENSSYNRPKSNTNISASDNDVSMSDFKNISVSDSNIIISMNYLKESPNTIEKIDNDKPKIKKRKKVLKKSNTTKTKKAINVEDLISRSIIYTSAGEKNELVVYQDIKNDMIYIICDNELKAVYPDIKTFEDIPLTDLHNGNYHKEKTVPLNLNYIKPDTDKKRIQDIINNSIISDISGGMNTDKVTYYLNKEDDTLYLITNDKKRLIAKYPPAYLKYNKNNIQSDNKYVKDNAIFDKIINDCELVLKVEDGTEIYENYNNYRVYVVINGKIVDEYKNSDEYNANNTKWDEGLDDYIYGGYRPRSNTNSTTSTRLDTKLTNGATTIKTNTTTQSKLNYIIDNCDVHPSSSEYATIYVDRKNGIVYVVSNNGVIIEYPDVLSYEGSLKADPIEESYESTTETIPTTVFTTTTASTEYVSGSDDISPTDDKIYKKTR